MNDAAEGRQTDRILGDVLIFAQTAARLVERGKSAYDNDEALRLAAEAILHKLGEGVNRLPETFIAAHPEVSWSAMKATRNLVAHQYEQVDYEIIWNALVHRLPQEAAKIRQIRGQIGGDRPPAS